MRRSLSLLGGLGLGLALSQFPEYAQQYTQRLGGAVDELKHVTEEFDATALAGGLTRDQALVRYSTSTDSFLSRVGANMTHTFSRYDDLKATLADVQGADPWHRLTQLPAYFDTEIGGRTLDNFKPAVPVTPEGFIYAAVGAVFGYVVISALISLILLPFRLRRYPAYRR
ncbi:MAG TPA: DUF2937 family protein [Devosiaceae bacterium]|jgi:hypothetical protein